jgi:hypothetical protein
VLEKLNEHGDEDTSSPAAMSLVAYWLRTCIEGHDQCNHTQSSQYCPTRVLDIYGVNDGKFPKLLQNYVLDGPYIALSHRWGLHGLPTTTKENLADRMDGINPAELSQTMRDAMRIVTSLGYRYIWIDALCIIQNSPDDWFSEASHMSNVFSGALFTIAVSDAEDHSQGIFRKRTARCLRPFAILTNTSRSQIIRDNNEDESEYYVFPKTNLVGAGVRRKGTLDTRGWILQEQLLSTRILYFDRGEIYWDCIQLSASESSPMATSLLEESDPDETWALKLVRRTLAGCSTEDILRARISDAWSEIIKNYSARQLTKQEDRLMALEGIIVPLTTILGDDPVAGMWREQLWRQLTWWTDTSDSGDEASIVFPAPSWSWLSVQKRVYYHNSLLGEYPPKDTMLHKFTDLQLSSFSIHNVHTEQLPGSTGVIGTLGVTARCFSYRLTNIDMKKVAWKRWKRKSLKLNTGRWMLDAPAELPLDVHCLIVAEETVAKMLVCLCIVPDKEQDGMWRRAGLCHWDGLVWQIPSYVGTELETRTFTLI